MDGMTRNRSDLKAKNIYTAARLVAAFTSLEYGMMPRNNGFVSDSLLRRSSRGHFNDARAVFEGLLRKAKSKRERAAMSANIRLLEKFQRDLRR